MPDKRDKEKNAVQGEAGRPIEELPRVNSDGSAQNDITAKLGWPAGVEDIEIELPRSHERARAAELLDDKEQPTLKPRRIN